MAREVSSATQWRRYHREARQKPLGGSWLSDAAASDDSGSVLHWPDDLGGVAQMSSDRWHRWVSRLRRAQSASRLRVEHIADDWRSVTIALRPRGIFGPGPAHTGAALYAMADTYPTLMVQRQLGAEFLVWDRAGSVELLAPARGRVWARLELGAGDLERMRRMTADGARHLHLFAVDIRDAEAMVVARVEKMIYVRRRARN